MNLTDLTQDLIISTVKPSISISPSPPSLALFSRMPRARKSRRSIFSSSGRRCGGMGEPSVGTKVCMPRLKWRYRESGALKVEDSTRRVWDVKLFTTPLKYDPYMTIWIVYHETTPEIQGVHLFRTVTRPESTNLVNESLIHLLNESWHVPRCRP